MLLTEVIGLSLKDEIALNPLLLCLGIEEVILSLELKNKERPFLNEFCPEAKRCVLNISSFLFGLVKLSTCSSVLSLTCLITLD